MGFSVLCTWGDYCERMIIMGLFDKLFSKKEDFSGNHIYAPLTGKAVSITEVPDPTFAEGMLGNGVAIIPTDGKVVAPCNATVDMMFTTGHAVSLVAENGAEILIHVGLETVGVEGKPFTVHVKNGDAVKKGDLLMEADLDNDTVVKNVLADEKIARFLEKNGGNIVKTIVVKNKLVNLIVK